VSQGHYPRNDCLIVQTTVLAIAIGTLRSRDGQTVTSSALVVVANTKDALTLAEAMGPGSVKRHVSVTNSVNIRDSQAYRVVGRQEVSRVNSGLEDKTYDAGSRS
jgi:hypothetical protein